MSKRSAGIGYGDKVEMTGESISPAPNNYVIKSTLNATNGWTMAVGRDVLESILKKGNKYDGIFLGLIQKTPGPG